MILWRSELLHHYFSEQFPVSASKVQSTPLQPGGREKIFLYYADPGSRYLVAEQRVISAEDDPVAKARHIFSELARGPLTKLLPTIPLASHVRGLYIMEPQTAVVDVTLEMWQQLPGGIRTEELAIFSIVNSLVLNVEAIKQVRFLTEGTTPSHQSGHFDLNQAFAANMLLIR